MKKIVILLPVYNDWDSLIKIINEISSIVSKIENFEFECLIVNDSSTTPRPAINKPKEFKSLKIINMKENRGHARCNAFGLKYIYSNVSFDYVVVMDSDGEDRPSEMISLIKKINENPDISVVAKRIKRSEGILFRSLYSIHKITTYFFTGKKINFGNYCCLTKKDISYMINNKSLWSSFSGAFKKCIRSYNEIDSIRGSRYFGPSKMSYFNLAIHSLSIIAVFKYTVVLRSTFILIILSLLAKNLGSLSIVLQILLVLFNLIIFSVSFRENKKALLESDKNILKEDVITH